MKTRYRYLLAFVILAAAAAVFVWKYTFRPSESSVASKKADVEIAASELLHAFETDENVANMQYLDKIVVISGTVESVSEDSLGISVYVKNSDAIAGIICSFDKKNLEITDVSKGMSVRIKGICTGYLMDVVMNKCSMEPGNKD